jgi:hypothetical protein
MIQGMNNSDELLPAEDDPLTAPIFAAAIEVHPFIGRGDLESTEVDLIVVGRVTVEVKPVESLLLIHEARIITYLKLSGCSPRPSPDFPMWFRKDDLIWRLV